MNEFRGRGNLGSAPELRRIEDGHDGRCVLSLRIYFDRLVPTREGEAGGFDDRGGFWLNASVWGRRAEALQPLLAKGMRVYVEGTLVQRTWQSRESGEDKSSLELEVDYLALDPSRVERIELRARQAGPTAGEEVQEVQPKEQPKRARKSK